MAVSKSLGFSVKLDELNSGAIFDMQRGILELDMCSIDARWVYDKIKMGNIPCLRDDGLTWEEFVEANPSCYIAYYEDRTKLGAEIRNRLVDLHRSGKHCAYFHPVEVAQSHGALLIMSRIALICPTVIAVHRESGDTSTLNFSTMTTSDITPTQRLKVCHKVRKQRQLRLVCNTPPPRTSKLTKLFKSLLPFRGMAGVAEKKAASLDIRQPLLKSVGKYEYLDNGQSLGFGVYGEVFKGWQKDVS